jgi:hypothetical protein
MPVKAGKVDMVLGRYSRLTSDSVSGRGGPSYMQFLDDHTRAPDIFMNSS